LVLPVQQVLVAEVPLALLALLPVPMGLRAPMVRLQQVPVTMLVPP
jgi:hypothetical protein